MIGSDATAKVANGSSWSVGGSLSIGHEDTATLTISAGSTVAAHDVVIGDESVGLGTVNVDGSNSGGASMLQYTSSLAVGGSGTGHLNITNGGTVAPTAVGTGAAMVRGRAGQHGSVSVDGAGSHFEAKSLSVGGNSTTPGGQGSVTLTDGATAQVATSVTTGRNWHDRRDGGRVHDGSTSTLASDGANPGQRRGIARWQRLGDGQCRSDRRRRGRAG